jgi:hypothetical protein
MFQFTIYCDCQWCFQTEQLISDFGGQLGLWMGISLVSVAEYGELVFKMIYTAVRNVKKVTRVHSAQSVG